MLQYAAGCMGKFSSGKMRPLLVKLHSEWDRRVILSNCHKLANAPSDLRKIFIVADMSLDERRRNTVKRLHDRAVRENKIVQLSSGSLTVDGVLTYTVKDGHVYKSDSEVVSELASLY